ncbi:MAG: VWA domain-containing protein [Pyrinomonadaceae bacterium]
MLSASAQELTRDLGTVTPSVDIVNKYGRVAVKAEAWVGDKPVGARLSATSPKGAVTEAEVKIGSSNGRTTISVAPTDKRKRLDIILTLPERTMLKVETTAGAIEVAGNFASVEARSETGTISADIPVTDVTYQLLWTESRPRVLADFEIAAVKEQRAGRFQIKGRYVEAARSETPPGVVEKPNSNPEDQISKAISLDLATSRGIILLNVPPGEVTSDLRERPLTEAAKAIVRSGDSLLMDAIRRASPKYFGDYARTLPPISMEPTFATRSARIEVPNAPLKTALVRVTDVKNRAIIGLRARDFEVLENGEECQIVSVEQSKAPFNLVLLLDVSGSVENYVNFIRKAARSFVNTVDKQDRVSIVIFNDDVKVLSRFTTDKGALSTSLDTFDAGGGTAYYDALAYAVSDTLRPLKGERTAIVILTDGDDNGSFLAFESLIGSIQESGALIYPLYVPSALIALAATGADIDPMRKKYMSLSAKSEGEGDRLAKVSGGVYYPISQISQIQQAYEDIVVQMRAAYEITYRSKMGAGGNGASPKLKIRAKNDNVFTAISKVSITDPDK